MNFGAILYTILISPPRLFFEFIFSVAIRFTNDEGLSIIVLSLVMNFLVLPLYKRADAMQAEERDTEAKLHDGVAHIKKVFSGDERMMILQEYYRQNHYKTMDAFKGSISLFLEIPFFIGAYQFLSQLRALQGVAFGPLANLGAQDGLLVIGGVTINLLPILMTAVNMVSCVIYTKGFPKKTKIQLYVMAIFFLFFLYSSPSGLVFYWTLNNIFSLCKNVFYKMKKPRKVLSIMGSVTGIILIGFALGASGYTASSKLILTVIGLALQTPLVLYALKRKGAAKKAAGTPDKKMFVLSAFLLTVNCGLLIPSAVIKASPQEFVDIYHYSNPLWYVASSLCLALGVFLIWFTVFYWLASREGKILFEKIMWIACGVSIVDYMFFGTNLGTLSASLKFDQDFCYSIVQISGNVGLLIALSLLMLFVLRRYKKLAVGALTVGILAICCMSAVNASYINNSVNTLKEKTAEETNANPTLRLSQTGKNVVVIMLDRAVGPMMPYLFNEKPELKKEFDGFTYYSNTVSFGGHTNFGSPALFGGYEYTPVEINKRSEESLVSKQNEAIKVMPVLFDRNGYDVTVCDPPYANYQEVPDLSVYDDNPDIKTYITNGKFNDSDSVKDRFKNNKRNFFCYSLMKSSPLLVQHFLYNDGEYMKPENQSKDEHSSRTQKEYSTQTREGNSIASGIDANFMNAYNVLANLSDITETDNSSTGAFVMMSNDTTHNITLLQEPEYEPDMKVDNTRFDEENQNRFTVDGKTMNMTESLQYQHYDCDMASMIQLGKWFDYLRENHLYDNTRIILVSDHGKPLNQFSELLLDNGDSTGQDMEMFTPLLMVKDFNSKGFTTSDEFMTNGDVPTLATSEFIQNPINPMTGNQINSEAKNAGDLYIIDSEDWETTKNNGNVFLPADWYSVHDNIWDINNWNRVSTNSTSPTP